jgi:Coenzyme PQQ synthesis protein D (PqqD)
MLWQVLEAPKRGNDVVAVLADLYGVAPAAIERDVSTLLEDLKGRGWVEQDCGGYD